ncbi:MAG: hypothetical protein QG671_378 [Actinomycetota bacterium]|nr:hypothetical protein [Actinomycetota bacterium]
MARLVDIWPVNTPRPLTERLAGTGRQTDVQFGRFNPVTHRTQIRCDRIGVARHVTGGEGLVVRWLLPDEEPFLEIALPLTRRKVGPKLAPGLGASQGLPNLSHPLGVLPSGEQHTLVTVTAHAEHDVHPSPPTRNTMSTRLPPFATSPRVRFPSSAGRFQRDGSTLVQRASAGVSTQRRSLALPAAIGKGNITIARYDSIASPKSSAGARILA